MESTVLHRASAGGTVFANCDLRSVIGLDTIEHTAPASSRWTLWRDRVAESRAVFYREQAWPRH